MKIAATLLFGLAAAPAAQAASAPPTTLLMGTVAASDVAGKHSNCMANAGQALFQRAAATVANPHPLAFVSVPSIKASGGNTNLYVDYVGVLRLNFTSATAGTLTADYDALGTGQELPTGTSFLFEKYSAIWTSTSSSLKVSFKIIFTAACVLPITALFRGTP